MPRLFGVQVHILILVTEGFLVFGLEDRFAKVKTYTLGFLFLLVLCKVNIMKPTFWEFVCLELFAGQHHFAKPPIRSKKKGICNPYLAHAAKT